jgi:hypothetical protein
MKLSNMANVLRAAGLTVVETPGWATRGYAGQDLAAVRGILWHHTATHRSRFAAEDAPTLSLCIHGRSDLPGPLCQIVFGRDGTVYLTAAGVSNHAGRGVAPNIPENQGNHYLIGIEMESSGIAPWDWTEDQKRVAPYLGAALERAYLSYLPEDLRLQLGHKEYSYDGKIDPAGWPGDMDGLRASINKVLTSTPEPAKKPTTPGGPVAASPLDALITEYKEDGKTPKDGKPWKSAARILGNIDQYVTRILRGQEEAKLDRAEIHKKLDALISREAVK